MFTGYCARRLICVLVAAVALFGAAPAGADNRDVARNLYREATSQYDVGEYSKALELFKSAYLAYQDPALLFNMAQCQRQLGAKQEAVRTYKSYLRNVADAPNRDEVQRIIAGLESDIARERAAAATPTSTEAGPLSTKPSASEPKVEAATTSPPPAAEKTPAYKKWWVWTLVGGAVAVGVGVGLGVGLTRNNFDTTLPALNKSSGLSVSFR